MAAIADLIEQVKKEAADAAAVVEVAKMVLVDLAKAVNAGLLLLNPGSAENNGGAKIRRKLKGKGSHQHWHNRLSGQYLYPDGTKACSNCYTRRPATLEYFHRGGNTPSKFQSWCLVCCDGSAAQAQRRREKNIDGSTPSRLGNGRVPKPNSRMVRTNSLDAAQ